MFSIWKSLISTKQNKQLFLCLVSVYEQNIYGIQPRSSFQDILLSLCHTYKCYLYEARDSQNLKNSHSFLTFKNNMQKNNKTVEKRTTEERKF